MIRSGILCLATLCCLLILLAGCSESETAPELQVKAPINATSDSLERLYFTMEFDRESSDVSIIPRGGQIDVTPWAEITLYDAQWVPSERNWYISAQLRNLSNLKGYGVWIVFTELGEKVVRDIDGFIYYGTAMIRVPLIALRKEAPSREFPGYHVEDHTIVIHWPDTVNSWDPVEFFVDASWPNPRKEPMVEELAQLNFPPPCDNSSNPGFPISLRGIGCFHRSLLIRRE